jgi:hypothetical protein
MRTITVALATPAIAWPTQVQQQPNHIVGRLTFSMLTLRHLAASTAFIQRSNDATMTIGINRVTGDPSVRYVDVKAKSVSKDSWTCEPAAQKF